MQKRTFVTPDDLEVGEYITVLHNRRVEEGFREQLGVESDYFKGTTLKIVAISLPYMVVEATDTSRGRATLTIDVRDHKFIRLSRADVCAVQHGSHDHPPDGCLSTYATSLPAGGENDILLCLNFAWNNCHPCFEEFVVGRPTSRLNGRKTVPTFDNDTPIIQT